MKITVADLPAPPPGRTGWPWTEGTPLVPAVLPNGAPWPSVTVVTPSYNQGEFLEETIRSVLLQGYPNLEYIVMDGGSQDNSPQILQKYGEFLAAWVSEPDKGQSDAVNKGLRRGTGEIMGWINSDDILLPGALQHTAEAFNRNPSISVTCGFRKVIDSDSRVLYNWFLGLPDDFYLQRGDCIAQETTFWRRQVWEKAGEIDAAFHYALDYEYYQRMLANGFHFTLLPYYMGGFRKHEQSKGANLEHVRQKELKVIYQRYGIGSSYDDAISQLDTVLGKKWRYRQRLIKELNHKRISDNPYVMLFIYRLLLIPIVLHISFACYRLFRWLKRDPYQLGN